MNQSSLSCKTKNDCHSYIYIDKTVDKLCHSVVPCLTDCLMYGFYDISRVLRQTAYATCDKCWWAWHHQKAKKCLNSQAVLHEGTKLTLFLCCMY